MQTTCWRLRVDRREISFLRFILEGYDGLAVLSTLDSATGDVELKIAPGCEPEVNRIIRDLRRHVFIEDVEPLK